MFKNENGEREKLRISEVSSSLIMGYFQHVLIYSNFINELFYSTIESSLTPLYIAAERRGRDIMNQFCQSG